MKKYLLPIRVNDSRYGPSKRWKGFKDFEEYPPFIQQYCHDCAKTFDCRVYEALKHHIDNRGNIDTLVESPILIRLKKRSSSKLLPKELVSCSEFMRKAGAR